MKLLERLRKLWHVAEDMERLRDTINERTTVHADIHMKSPSLVIVVGEYRGSDYVRAFEVPHKSLSGLIDHLRHIEPNARVGRMDMIPRFKFSAVYPHKRL